METTPDWTDDSVYSNVAYMLPALTALWLMQWGPAVLLGTAGGYLTYASGRFHATYRRPAQRLDVHAMMSYFAALTAVVYSTWTPWAYAAVAPVSAVYYVYTWDVNSFVHVPIWFGIIVVGLSIQIGWEALLPTSIFVVGAVLQLLADDPDSELHSVWHVTGGIAAAVMIWALT